MAGRVTRRKDREVRRPMAPAAGAAPAQIARGVNESGFRIPLPKGIRPLVNARVAVGDERIPREEEQLYGEVPPEEELDGLGEGAEDDPQTELEEEQFSAPVPAVPPVPPRARPAVAPMQTRVQGAAPAQAQPTVHLTLPSVAIEDTDRLWDWVRQDADKGAAFFGKPLGNSMELHDLMKDFLAREAAGTGCVRSIYWGNTHLGLVALVPILSTERVTILHAYLSPGARPSMGNLLVGLVALAMQLVPGYHVGLMALTPAQVQMYQQLLSPHGFAPHTLFLR